VHPGQEEFSRGCRDSRTLKLEDFLPLAPDLDPHVFDFPPDEVQIRHVPPRRNTRRILDKTRTRRKPLGIGAVIWNRP
jgi:hypothetical protein